VITGNNGLDVCTDIKTYVYGTAIGHEGDMLLQLWGNKAQDYCHISSKRQIVSLKWVLKCIIILEEIFHHYRPNSKTTSAA
jgi:hypothetical protein